MRLILTLVAVLIIGLLVAKQLQSPASVDVAPAAANNELPSVPTRPQDVPQFEQDINNYINQAAEEQARKIEEATGQ